MDNTNRNLSMVEIIPLKPFIDRLMKESAGDVAVQNFCTEYSGKLADGMHDEQLCESFVADLAKIAFTESTKAVLAEVNESMIKNKGNIDLANKVYDLSKSSCMFVAPMIESAMVDYITNKNAETREELRANISIFENEQVIRDIMGILDFESYEEKSGKSLINAVLKESAVAPVEKTYTQAEVDALIANKVNEQKAVEETPKFIESHIGLQGAINNILKEHSNNEKLKVFCEQYMSALNSGKAEETLYEAFISGASNWNYLNAVDTELSALKDRVGKYKQDIDLKKIMETMKETSSYYIVPLIEDVLVEYVNHKNMTNRGILLQRLDAFGYDPFVRDIVNVVTRDNSIPNSVYLGESVEYARNLIHTEEVFSPVKYIKENECVFNVKGFYYIRKGNTVNKMTKNEVADLSESFKTLCGLVNSSNVILSNELNTITVFDGENEGVISESAITINGQKITESDLESLASNTRIVNADNYRFYNIVKILNENYSDIAYLDFVKRVASNDGNRAVDVFRINENLYVNTVDDALGRSVFYRNVNPIQCRNYINEHMEINVSPIFEDVLPDQENIEQTVKEKCNEYDSYIESLEEKKDTLMKMKDEGADEEDINKAIDMIDQEIKDAKDDYKKYQDNAKDFFKGKAEDKDDSLDNEAPKTDDEDGADKDDVEKKGDTDDTDTKADKEGEDEDEVKETPAEMEEPITAPATEEPASGEEEVNIEDGADIEDDEYIDVPEFDAMFDVPVTAIKDMPVEGGSADEDIRFKIAKVSYNKNVKTGKTSSKGEVIVIIPSVDANGEIHDETRKVQFYLDEDRNPVIGNEYMPLDLYMAIKDAIENDPNTETVEMGNEIEQVALSEPSEDEVLDVTTLPAAAAEPTEETEVKVEDTPEETEVETKEETPVVPAAEVESPAEVKDVEDEVVTYPISLGVYPEEISPKEVADFEKDMDTMKIEHSTSEANDGEITLKVNNLAQVHGLQKYFNKWFNYTTGEFTNFFPELKKCFDNKPSTIPVQPTNESIDHEGKWHFEEGNPVDKYMWHLKTEAKYDAEHDGFVDAVRPDGWPSKKWLDVWEKDVVHDTIKGEFSYKIKDDAYSMGELWDTVSSYLHSKKHDHFDESVKILGISKEEGSKYPVSLILPCNEAFCKMVGTTYEDNVETLQVIAENENDMKQIYEGIYLYSKKNEIDQDLTDILESYKADFGELCESECVYNLTVPYNAFLEQKLMTKGFSVNVLDESMTTEILKPDYSKAKKILEAFYGENVPAEANDFFQLSENVKITIKDEKTGKTVEINTEDAIEDVKETTNDGTDFDQAFKDVTFNPESSMMFSDDKESADEEDEDKEKKDDEKKDEDNDEEVKEEEETKETEETKEDEGTKTEESEKSEDEESEEDSEGDKKSEKRKTFKFKVTKKAKNESVKEDGTGVKPLNEEAEGKPQPNVLDIVEDKEGKRGQVICQQADGKLIVNMEGHTKIYAPKDLTLPQGKFDTLQAPFKYDAATLKGIYENYVNCGVFINNVQVTPNTCKVQLLEYLTAPEDAEINLSIDGENTPALKQYVRITEDIDKVIDMANYGEGTLTYLVEGVEKSSEVLIHLGDYANYRMVKESTEPVRVLLKDDNGETHLRHVAGGNIRLKEGYDVYTPEYELLAETAINLLS